MTLEFAETLHVLTGIGGNHARDYAVAGVAASGVSRPERYKRISRSRSWSSSSQGRAIRA